MAAKEVPSPEVSTEKIERLFQERVHLDVLHDVFGRAAVAEALHIVPVKTETEIMEGRPDAA